MQVARRSVAEDDARVVVLGKQRSQVERAVGEPLRREANVLEDERRSRWTRAADRRQQSAAYVPELRSDLRVFRERGRLQQAQPGQRFRADAQSFRPSDIGRSSVLDEQCGRGIGQRLPSIGHAGLAFDGAQRCAIEQFHGGRAAVDEGLDGCTCFVHVGKDHERCEPKLIVGNRIEDRFDDEGQRPFGSHDQPAEDLARRRAVEECLHVVAGRVLDAELPAKAGDEVRIRFDRPLDFDQPGRERRLGCGELLIGIRKARVDRRTGGQHESERRQRLVGVLSRPAAHSARVVSDYAAYRACRRACRIRADPISVRNKGRIAARQDRAGPRAQTPPPASTFTPDQ